MNLWNEVISIVVSNGVFATIFVFLFLYQLKDSAKREKAYQKTITDLTQHLKTIEEVKEEVSDLKHFILHGEINEE